MNLKNLNRLVIIVILMSNCSQKDCTDIEEKDIVGYYISMNSLNENLQYLELVEGGKYKNTFCQNGVVIRETNDWEYSHHCTVTLANIHWLNSPFEDFSRATGANFGFNYGKILSLGDDVWSFKKVRFKPKLECE